MLSKNERHNQHGQLFDTNEFLYFLSFFQILVKIKVLFRTKIRVKVRQNFIIHYLNH